MTDRRNTWSEAMDAALSRLWADGVVSGEIARHFRTTRNAVIGRVHRLHLPPRPSPIAGYVPRPPAPRPRKAEKPVIVAPPVVVPPPPMPSGAGPEGPPVPCVRLCQYPHGDPGEPGFRFCEAAVRGAGPYCQTHIRLCWTGRARAA